MKNTLHALFVTMFIGGSVIAQTVEKTLVSSFNPNGQTSLVLNVDGNVATEYWKGDVVKVQSTISVEKIKEAVLKSLVTAGRYSLKSEVKNDCLEIASPNLNKKVTLGGVPIEEHISYLIYVPENMVIMYNEIESLSQINSTIINP